MSTSDASSAHTFTNRLAGETSPYLLQHAHNPVDWYPWGAEALAAAKDGDKPIFLSIGYAACHWCHVMERESFEDPATAEDLRRDFIAIKVDREERPDLDQVYMAAVQAMTGGGGWPMSVFLTPAGRPFYGGTYFPPVPTHGLPAFRQVLAGVAQAWREDRASVEASGARLVDALVAQARAAGADGRSARLEPDGVRSEAMTTLESGFDTVRAGWGGAPKFPPSMTLEFLLRTATGPDGRVSEADPEAARALAMAIPTLDAMAAGGIHDQLGGGFHRYSTDRNWLVPHFEQMLYDNAQLALAYLDAWRLTGERRHLETAQGVLDFMATRLRRSDGAFAASLDADTDGVEGSTFTWTATDIREVLGPDRSSLFEAAYGVTDRGNWEGRAILSRVASSPVLAARFGREAADVDAELDSSRRMLIEVRDRRPQPNRDDKALAAWNGLAIAAFAEAASALRAHEPAAAQRLRDLAVGAATAIVDGLWRGGRLSRSWKDGRATADGVLEDYADLANGLLSLYEATFDERWFLVARELGDAILDRFADPVGGFFDTADDAERLVSRPKDLQDNAVPSGGAIAATVLLRLAALTGETRYRSAAEAAIAGVVELAGHHPTFFGQWLVALGLMARPPAEVAIVGSPEDSATQSLLATARRGYRPSQVVAVSADPGTSAVPLLQGRFALNGRPTAFVCRDFACRQPVNEPAALDAFLNESRAASTWG